MAIHILGRSPIGEKDYKLAFNLERIDLLAEIPDRNALLVLGYNIAGTKDGLYVIDDGETYRVYLQEKGIVHNLLAELSFDSARDAVIDRMIWVQGIPFELKG